MWLSSTILWSIGIGGMMVKTEEENQIYDSRPNIPIV